MQSDQWGHSHSQRTGTHDLGTVDAGAARHHLSCQGLRIEILRISCSSPPMRNRQTVATLLAVFKTPPKASASPLLGRNF